MSTKSKQKRPEYTLEFKQDAAKLVNEKGYTHRQAADSLGVSLSVMGRWARAEKSPAQSTAAKKTVLNLTDQAELTRLRRENEQLRMEREILKKAAVFFAKEVE
ncbi:MAG: transposase [Dehalococcoidia bacterium]|jgi:transposase|nr:transposase [Dehalococcoidia bacterium]